MHQPDNRIFFEILLLNASYVNTFTYSASKERILKRPNGGFSHNIWKSAFVAFGILLQHNWNQVHRPVFHKKPLWNKHI